MFGAFTAYWTAISFHLISRFGFGQTAIGLFALAVLTDFPPRGAHRTLARRAARRRAASKRARHMAGCTVGFGRWRAHDQGRAATFGRSEFGALGGGQCFIRAPSLLPGPGRQHARHFIVLACQPTLFRRHLRPAQHPSVQTLLRVR